MLLLVPVAIVARSAVYYMYGRQAIKYGCVTAYTKLQRDLQSSKVPLSGTVSHYLGKHLTWMTYHLDDGRSMDTLISHGQLQLQLQLQPHRWNLCMAILTAGIVIGRRNIWLVPAFIYFIKVYLMLRNCDIQHTRREYLEKLLDMPHYY